MNKNKYFIIMIFILTVSLGIGYASISDIDLSIDGEAIANRQTGIFISDVEIENNVDADMNNTSINHYNQTNLNTKVSLSTTNPNSNLSMTVTIFNNSGSIKYFDQILYESEFYDNPNIIIELDNRLQAGQILRNQESVTFTATFKYSDSYIDSATTPYWNELNSYINFHFTDTSSLTYYDINYINFDTNTYPTEILEGEDLVITFSSPIPTNVLVTGSTNYTYQNGVLTVPDVQDNLTIENLSNYDFPVTVSTVNTEWHTDKISSSNPTNVNDFLNMTFTGTNKTDKVINRIDVTLTYTSTTGSNQSINCFLAIGSQTEEKQIQLTGKQTNREVTVSFTNLNIEPGTEFTFTNSTSKLTNANITISDKKIVAYFSN